MTALTDRVAVMEKNPGQGAKGSVEHGKAAGWKPSYVEIKGACKFEDVETKGIPREFGMSLVDRLKSELPTDAQQAISDPIMLGAARAYSIKIPIKDPTLIDT
eukprot:214284-Karenia_brevis.AAC.1